MNENNLIQDLVSMYEEQENVHYYTGTRTFNFNHIPEDILEEEEYL